MKKTAVDATSLRDNFLKRFSGAGFMRPENKEFDPIELEITAPNHADLLYSICLFARNSSKYLTADEKIHTPTFRKEFHKYLFEIVIGSKRNSYIRQLINAEINPDTVRKLNSQGLASDTTLGAICVACSVKTISLQEFVEDFISFCLKNDFIDHNPAFNFNNGVETDGVGRLLVEEVINKRLSAEPPRASMKVSSEETAPKLAANFDTKPIIGRRGVFALSENTDQEITGDEYDAPHLSFMSEDMRWADDFSILNTTHRYLLSLSSMKSGISVSDAAKRIALKPKELRKHLTDLKKLGLVVILPSDLPASSKVWQLSKRGEKFLKVNPWALYI